MVTRRTFLKGVAASGLISSSSALPVAASRSGIQFFPVRRLLCGGPIPMKYNGGPHG